MVQTSYHMAVVYMASMFQMEVKTVFAEWAVAVLYVSSSSHAR